MNKRFYVYILYRRDGVTPFYVGKGSRDRWAAHLQKDGFNPHKINIIKEMRRDGVAVPKEKVAWGLTEEDAFSFEKYLIQFFGREANGGLLTNLTDGGDGISGYKWTREQIESFKISMNRPEKLAINSAALKKYFQDPEARIRSSLAAKKRFEKPGAREAHRAAQKLVMSRPEVRAKLNQTAPETRALHSVSLKKYYENNPDAHNRASEAHKKRWADQDARARHSAILKTACACPKLRAIKSANIRAYWAKRKASQRESSQVSSVARD
jgi:hypothetical protein